MVETIILLHKTCSLMVNKLFSLTKHHLYGAQKFWRFILHYIGCFPITKYKLNQLINLWLKIECIKSNL